MRLPRNAFYLLRQRVRRVQREVGLAKLPLGILAHLGGGKHALVRGPGQIEALGDLGALTGLGDQLHLGLEEVHVQPEHPVQLTKGLELGGCVVAGVTPTLWRTTGQFFCSTKQLSFLR